MSRSKRIAKNTIYLYLRLLIVMGVSLYTVRVVLQALGIQDYGIYGVAAASVAIFAFIGGALSQASQRFLSIDIGKGNQAALSRTFNATFVLHICVALIVVLLSETLGLWLFNNKLEIPESRLVAANHVYQFSVASSVLMILQLPFMAIIVAREELWFFALVGMLEALSKLGIAYAVLNLEGDKLELYALFAFIAATALFFLYSGFSLVKFSETRLRPHREWKTYRELAGFISWSFIGNAAGAGRTQGVNLLLNVFFGPVANAAYGVMNQVQNAVTSFTNSLQTALSPQIYQSYGGGDQENVHNLTMIGSKVSFMLLLVMVVPVMYGVDQLLYNWLGSVPENAEGFVKGILIVLLIDTVSLPLIAALAATGKIKWYQISVGGLLLMNVPASYIAFRLTARPDAFLYVAVCLSVLALVLRLYFLARMISFRISDYARRVILPALILCVFSSLVVFFVESLVGRPDSLFAVFRGVLIIIPMIISGCFVFGVTRQERVFLFSKIVARMKK